MTQVHRQADQGWDVFIIIAKENNTVNAYIINTTTMNLCEQIDGYVTLSRKHYSTDRNQTLHIDSWKCSNTWTGKHEM